MSETKPTSASCDGVMAQKNHKKQDLLLHSAPLARLYFFGMITAPASRNGIT